MNRPIHVVLSLLLVLGLSLPLGALAQAPAPGQLRGVLLDGEGLPAEGYQVSAKAANGDLFNSTMSAADGSFVVPGMPAGEYTLVAIAPDGSEYPVIGGPIKIGAGETQRLELRIADIGMAPGRDADAVRGIQEGTDSERRRGGFWQSRTGRVVLIVGGIAGAGHDPGAGVAPGARARRRASGDLVGAAGHAADRAVALRPRHPQLPPPGVDPGRVRGGPGIG